MPEPQVLQGQVPSTPPTVPVISATDSSIPKVGSRRLDLSNPAVRARNYQMPHDAAYKVAGDIMQQQTADIELRHRYANINNAKDADKIEALKDITLDPRGFTNRADSIAFSYNRWRYVAADAQQKNPSKLQEIATNYYKKEIEPFYKELGIPKAMPLDLWLKHAYSPYGALLYNLEDSYHGDLVTGIYRGLHAAFGQLETLGGTGVNLLGYAVQRGRGNEWHENLSSLMTKGEKPGFFQRAQELTQAMDNPAKRLDGKSFKEIWNAEPETFAETLGHDSKTFQHWADEDEFWEHVNPSKGYKDIVTSSIVELVATLPVFGAVRSGEKVLFEGGLATLKTTGRGIKVANTLTEVLNATPKGKLIAQTLAAGGEGLGYGLLTRPNEDKSQAWKDAVAFMVGENIFRYAGKKLKLKDVLKESGNEDAILDHEQAMEVHKRGAEDGQRLATPAERRQAYVDKHANDMAQVGIEGVREQYIQAVDEIRAEDEEGISRSKIASKHAEARKIDPAGAVPVQTAKGFVRDFLNGRKISELSKEARLDLTNQVDELIQDAANHLDRSSEAISTANATNVSSAAGGKNAELVKAQLRQSLMVELEEHGLAKTAKPDEIEAMVEQRYQKAQSKAAAQAEARRSRDPEREATEAADTRTEGDKLIRRSGQETGQEGKSSITTATRGEARFKTREASHNVPYGNYLVYLKKAAGGTSNEKLAKFYDGMDSEDFEKELEKWMYPKALKDKGLYFEHEHTREGKQNPNFLAFMLNYADQMPAPMARKLSTELEESLKFEKNFKGSKVTDSQKWHYALQMYNHVDTFLNSTTFMKRGELNVFRSTQSDLLNPTVYQTQLLDEMHKENLKLLSEMFPKAREKTAARFAYSQLAGELNSIFMHKPTPATARLFRQQSDAIAAWMIGRSEGTLDRWNF